MDVIHFFFSSHSYVKIQTHIIKKHNALSRIIVSRGIHENICVHGKVMCSFSIFRIHLLLRPADDDATNSTLHFRFIYFFHIYKLFFFGVSMFYTVLMMAFNRRCCYCPVASEEVKKNKKTTFFCTFTKIENEFTFSH